MATELEVPYATLRKQLQREPLRSWITPFLTMKGNTKYITEEGERVIRWQYPEKEPKIKELEELLVEKENQVTELVEMIRRELEEKMLESASWKRNWRRNTKRMNCCAQFRSVYRRSSSR